MLVCKYKLVTFQMTSKYSQIFSLFSKKNSWLTNVLTPTFGMLRFEFLTA